MKLIKEKRLFLLDMDGTIYHENTLIPGASEFLQTLKAQGKKYVFMTNNSSKSNSAYVKKLNALGIIADENNVVSSMNSTISYLNKRKRGAKVCLVGTQSFREELENNGIKIVPPSSSEDDIDYVVVGFDTELTYEKIEKACFYISRGTEYIATNIDLKCPVRDDRFIPDCGAICNLIGAAVNKEPLFFGKPSKEMVITASELHNVPLDKIMCIGDRLYTDIACGINAGVITGVVFTGETKPDDILKTKFRPDYHFESIADLYEIIK